MSEFCERNLVNQIVFNILNISIVQSGEPVYHSRSTLSLVEIGNLSSNCLILHEISTIGLENLRQLYFHLPAAMADPLTLLRQYYTSGKTEEIVEAEGQIVFGDLAWPKDVRTNFKAYG